MPQMMPLNWLLLMMFFMTIFFLIMNLFYFNKIFKPFMNKNSMKNLLNHSKPNWTW
uniref:ATP synthase F0 subunit 8 n=1 Tax=Hydropsyche gautamittra TaxID=3381247 RepID=UPI0022375D49|nr:ATP synthase F0 subunit 8 [Ceratopsyche gautamittra]UYO79295.1 ATP synthase F0 subunit 8 [Ceratopsyche gautamittra]